MDLQKAENLAIELISEYLDSSWSFRWNKRKRAFGLCHYGHNTIELSRILTESETEEATHQTILHEIAHALAGFRAGHGPEWKMHARRIGVKNPKCSRQQTGTTQPKFTWAVKHDGKIVKGYFRKPNRRILNNISGMWLTGRPETKGQLYIERVA
jgi:predicted SprT family Zn-dependent metalloprotease